MIEAVLFLIISCVIIGTALFCCYKMFEVCGADYGTAMGAVFLFFFFFGLMWLNYGVFFPNEMNEYYIRREAERIIQDRKNAEWKVAAEIKKKADTQELMEMMQKLKEKKQHGS